MIPAPPHEMRNLRPALTAVAVASVLAGTGVSAESAHAATLPAPVFLPATAGEPGAGSGSLARGRLTPLAHGRWTQVRGEVSVMRATGRKIG